jgi:phosphoglycolate phosphatase-like HAD superfamily hydrolase
MLKEIQSVFIDFDGVIKDSVEAKSDVFEQIFLPFGNNIAKRVRSHHEANGGMSRFEKLPIYLKWANQEPLQGTVDEYADRFALLVRQKVIDSQWVDGVLDFLKNNYNKKHFFLVTATPQQEIEEILSSLKIRHFFKEIIGSPTTKKNAIKIILNKYLILSESSIMIGDSSSDYIAAKLNGVPFILRRTELNKELESTIDCLVIDNFL